MAESNLSTPDPPMYDDDIELDEGVSPEDEEAVMNMLEPEMVSTEAIILLNMDLRI